jgi:hypothetical protein
MGVAGVDEDNNNNNESGGSSSSSSSSSSGEFPVPPPEEMLIEPQYESKIDWDAEWKKVKKNQGQPSERPGKNFYKSEAELAAIRAANRAASELNEKASFLSSVPSFDSLKGDWKVSVCEACLPAELHAALLTVCLL